jgi:signal transduction histidine kinase
MPFSDLDKANQPNSPTAAEQADDTPSFAIRRSEYVDRIAHDLKTPFFGAAEILQLILNGGCGKIEPELEPLLLLLKQTNEELLLMTQRLVEIYRYESGPDALNLAATDLVTILGESVNELQSMAKATEITLCFSASHESCELNLDQSAIQEMLSYLLVNCIKHTALGGSLEVELEKLNDIVSLAVKTNGLGITQRDLDSIFLLARQHSASQSYSPLAGLELHLCRQIIHAHGGSISTEENGDGCVSIIIKLPFMQ